MKWRAITDQKEIRATQDLWESKLSHGAEVLRGHSGDLYYLPEFGIWGGFRSPIPDRKRYWNPFGKSDTGRVSGIAVEINSPIRGFNPNIQGGLAIGPDGCRWALHQGFLHTPIKNITTEMFAAATVLRRVKVWASDGQAIPYYPAVNIDAPELLMKQQLAAFIQECSRVRETVLGDSGASKAAREEVTVQAAENALVPEPVGFYVIPPQESKRAERLHGDVWKELVRILRKRGLSLSNQRIGRFGPDLRTWGDKRILFEIKAGSDAHSIQQAIGQLFLYEKLLQKTYKKVLVRPGRLPSELVRPFREMGVTVLVFAREGRKIRFERESLNSIVGE